MAQQNVYYFTKILRIPLTYKVYPRFIILSMGVGNIVAICRVTGPRKEINRTPKYTRNLENNIEERNV